MSEISRKSAYIDYEITVEYCAECQLEDICHDLMDGNAALYSADGHPVCPFKGRSVRVTIETIINPSKN